MFIKRYIFSFFILLSLVSWGQTFTLTYPFTKKILITDNYFGNIITDEYRWLEYLQDSSVLKWVKSQNDFTDNYFSKIPYYDKIKKNIDDKSGYYMDIPYNRLHGYTFALFSNEENKNPNLYYRTEFENWIELINPSSFKKSLYENVRITGYSLSPDEKYLTFNLSRNGSDWNEIYTIDMNTKKIIEKPIQWVKFSNIQWFENGFFYQRYNKPQKDLEYIEQNSGHSLFYHSITDNAKEDSYIEIEEFNSLEKLEGRSLIIKHQKKIGSKNYNLVSLIQLADSAIKIKEKKTFMVYPAKNRYTVDVIDIKKDSVIILTDLHANNGLVAKYSINDLNRFDTLVREYDEVLVNAFYFQGKLNCIYEKDFKYFMTRFSKNGKMEKSHLFSSFSTISFYSIGKKSTLYFDESTFSQPEVTCAFNFDKFYSNQVSVTNVKYEPGEYITDCIEYESFDGVKVPMTLFYKKSLEPKKNHPVLLSTYGGFGIINNPQYDYRNLLWVENGGIYAVAHIRGGGEKGKKWHFGGSNLNKQISIDDFSSAARFLIKNNYTSPEKLSSIGASNGGLVVAASALQHPELFKAVIPCVGATDMLRYQNFTIGSGLVDEYGVSTDSTQFNALIKYSPLHLVKDSLNYPDMLIITYDHDDRVPPFHSYKLTAKMQANKNSMVLLHSGVNSGHYGIIEGKNKYTESALILSFLFNEMNINPKLID